MSDKAIYEVINELALRDIIWEKSCDLNTIAQNYAVVKQLQSSSWFALFPQGVERKYINLLDRIFFEDDKLEYIISQFSFDKILLKFMLEEVFFKISVLRTEPFILSLHHNNKSMFIEHTSSEYIGS